MPPGQITLSFLCLLLICCHIGTYRSEQSLSSTPGQFTRGNVRKTLRPPSQHHRQVSALVTLAFLLAGDVHCNPGPRQSSYYPCGLCDRDVKCHDCVQCDCCSIWYHRSCIELSAHDFELLQRSTVQWACPKCDSLNCGSFTFRSFSIDSQNYYHPLQDLDDSIPSFGHGQSFSPLKTSSPHSCKANNSHLTAQPPQNANMDSQNANTTHDTQSSSPPFDLPTKKNLRIMTVNCRSLEKKKEEFKAIVNFVKPDVICGTESWLKPDVQHSEVFPEGYTCYRKDRSTLAGGVFILIHKSLVSTVQPDLDADCELLWVKLLLQRNKDILIGCFYLPHRNLHDLTELEKSLNATSASGKRQHILLAGDFNCPDVNWDSGAVNMGAPERPVQQALVDITSTALLTQIHEEPTREGAK